MESLDGGIQPSEQARVWSLWSLWPDALEWSMTRWTSCPIVMTSVLASETAPVYQLGDGGDLRGPGRAVREQADLGVRDGNGKGKDENSAMLVVSLSPFARNLANVPSPGLDLAVAIDNGETLTLAYCVLSASHNGFIPDFEYSPE